MEKRIRVLLSENGAEFLREYGRPMEEAGMEVLCTEKDGGRLLEKIRELHPDVVVADLFLPRLDAIGVMKACGAQKGSPRFLILSSFTSPSLDGRSWGRALPILWWRPSTRPP